MLDKLASSASANSSGSSPMGSNEEKLQISKLEEELLSLLVGRELYGLQITKAFEDVSQGKRKLSIGTLYPTLSRLEERGLVSSRMEERPKDDKGGARRKYFRITPSGMHALVNAEEFRKGLYHWQPV